MKSVLLPFYTQMELEAYPERDKRDIIRIIAKYLLGCSKFKTTKDKLSDYECQASFQDVLRSLTPPYHALYRKRIRHFLKGKDVKLHEFDEYHFSRLDNSKLNVRILKYPSEADVIKSMAPTINSRAFKLGTNRQFMRMTECGQDDMKQLIYMRMLQAYRTYLPSLGKFCPLKAFYRILHRAVDSSILDKLRQFNSNKAQLLVPFAILGQDFENSIDAGFFNTGRFQGSPEQEMQAKERLCLGVSHKYSSRYIEAIA